MNPLARKTLRQIEINGVKVCGACGERHFTIPLGAAVSARGFHWNCQCKSTLYVRATGDMLFDLEISA